MRITDNIKFATIKSNIQRNSLDNFKASERVVTGKMINRPSDNPAGMQEVLHLKKLQSSVEQHMKNMDRALTSIKMTETVLDRVDELLSEAKSIALTEQVSAQSDTRDSAAVQIGEILNEMFSLANTRSDEKYMFAGFKNTTQPFDPAAGPPYTYNGDTGVFQIAIDEQRKLPVNLNGDDLFKGGGTGTDIFTLLNTLKTDLETDNVSGVSGAISSLIQSRDQIEKGRVLNASRHETISASMENLKGFKLNLLDRISNVEDADLATAVLEMQHAQSALEVSLSASASFMKSSLLNFLR